MGASNYVDKKESINDFSWAGFFFPSFFLFSYQESHQGSAPEAFHTRTDTYTTRSTVVKLPLEVSGARSAH